MADETEYQPIGSKLRIWQMLLIFLVLLLCAAIILWMQRSALADNYVRGELDSLDISASYEIAGIDLNKQVIRNLIIGNPDHPDFTAEEVEVGLGFFGGSVGISRLRVKNGRIFGIVRDGKITFGELDKLSDPNSDSPLSLPDMFAEIQGMGISISGDLGNIGAKLSGKGNLQHGFTGELAGVSNRLQFGNCELSSPSLYGTLRITGRKPSLDGPLRVENLNCLGGDMALQKFSAGLKLTMSEDLASWTAYVDAASDRAKVASFGVWKSSFSANLAGDLQSAKGSIELAAPNISGQYLSSGNLVATSDLSVNFGGEQITYDIVAKPVLSDARLSKKYLRSFAGFDRGNDLPFDPLITKFVKAGRAAAGHFGARATIVVRQAENQAISVSDLSATSRSGGSLLLTDDLITERTPGGWKTALNGRLTLSGGDFPTFALRLDQANESGFAGQMFIEPYRSQKAELRLPAIRFTRREGGRLQFSGSALLNGPLAGGTVIGLKIPINGWSDMSSRFALLTKCEDIRFERLNAAGVDVRNSKIKICPSNNRAIVSSGAGGLQVAANMPALGLKGTLGDSPFGFKTSSVDYSLERGFKATGVIGTLGRMDAMNEFGIASLAGVQTKGQWEGTIEGGSGQIANVPLLLENIEVKWLFRGGELSLITDMKVSDAEQVDRFKPMMVKEAELSFANNIVTTNGLLREPSTGTIVSDVNIHHELDSGVGWADLNVAKLVFDEALQPEMLTPLTLGVVANVFGQVDGAGRIDWNDDGVTSTGEFKTEAIDLAAAFGPVTKLSGTIKFIDLLGLETAAGQLVKLGNVNPGVPVDDGEIRYQLLPGQRMLVEGGRWPFAGGELVMEPTTLNLAIEEDRNLAFRVVGVDAGQFLNVFEFDNLSATGVFDGRLPMVFDQDGGRIVGGYLTVREGGGSLSYVGELSTRDLGTMANFAFGALKSVRYDSLTIGMNGVLDGEIITDVKFAGIQQGDSADRNFITKQLAKIPIIFNVKITAPFMQLITSARSFYDPEILVGQNLTALLDAQKPAANDNQPTESKTEQPVQHPESESVP